MARTHKDVEYVVSDHAGNCIDTVRDPEKAMVVALAAAIVRGESTLDVLVWSEAGARSLGGDSLERYREDPDASVFERFEIKVNAQRLVP